jgi:hypothetical protein
MEQQNQEPAPTDPSLPQIVYKDRASGLKVFGGLAILLGALCVLLSLLSVAGMAAAAKMNGGTSNT